ncbi:MAG: DNA alkylation repair protein [Ferruginibacter sp.]
MPMLLKHIYNDVFFNEFGKAAETVIPHFKSSAYINKVQQYNWDLLQLKQRMRRLSFVLHDFIPGSYSKQLTTILSLIAAIPNPSKVQYAGLAYMFLPDFIEQFGQDDLVGSLKALEKITPFSSCEFAIRPFLRSHSNETMQQMEQWAQHTNEHVRRFASEGCRPRLPWGMGIDLLKKNPSIILPILNLLKNDESPYVRRSVANNLNDISKDHPEIVLEIAAKWLGKTTQTDHLLKNACRGLLKKGDPLALNLFGTANHVKCSVTQLKGSSKKIAIGGNIQFSFVLQLLANESARLRIEYAVHFMKANGEQRQKVFKISESHIKPNEKVIYTKKQSFKDLTTRKHYPGEHKISIIVNGVVRQQLTFSLLKIP